MPKSQVNFNVRGSGGKIEEYLPEQNAQRILQLADLMKELRKANMIGSANSDWIPTVHEGAYPQTAVDYANIGIRNTGANDYLTIERVILAPNRGGKKLYIKGIRIIVSDSDADDYIDQVRLWGRTYDAGTPLKTIDFDTVHGTGIGEFSDAFTAIDCSSYNALYIIVDVVATTADECDWHGVEIDAYYDT